MTTVSELGGAKYVRLTTFRKDGRAVPTPLWVVPDGNGLAAWTVAGSGKVKRLRRDGRVTVAPCDMRGTVSGPEIEARARIGDAADAERVRRAIGRKYGLVGRLTIWGSKLRRGADGTVALLITPAG
jgi:PPOX class probable F420-dependent enzyme